MSIKKNQCRIIKDYMVKYTKSIFKGGIIVMFKIDKSKFEEHINSKWNNRICPMCQGSEWSYDEDIQSSIYVNEKKRFNFAEKFSPLISVTCVNCGNTLFVNGLVAKSIIDTPEENKGE